MSGAARWLFAVVWVIALGSAIWLYEGRTNRIVWHGAVESSTHEVASREPGRLIEVKVDVGQPVAAGDVLARLDTNDLEAELTLLSNRREALERVREADKAKLEYDQTRDEIDVAQSLARLERSIFDDRTELRAGEAELEALDQEIERLEGAVDSGLARRDDLGGLKVRRQRLVRYTTELRTGIVVQQRRLASTREQLTALRGSGSAESLVVASAADRTLEIIAIDERIAEVKREIAERIVLAPVSGVVSAVQVKPGDVVQAWRPLLRVEETSSTHARVFVPAAVGNEPEVGEKMALLSARGIGVEGRIVFVSPTFVATSNPATNNGPRARQVRVELPSGHGLAPGEPVEARLGE